MNEEKIRIIGLTGPTGSGKSMVADIFEEYGYIIIDADEVAREAVELDSVRRSISDVFGDDLYKDGCLDRKELSRRAFSSRENELKLNSITHGAIIELTKAKINEYTDDGKKNIMYDAPLLFEAGADSFCTGIVSVIADPDIRIRRIKKRDGLTDDEAKARISVQHEDSYYIDRSDFVIYNNSSQEELRKRTLEVLAEV